MKQQKVRLHYLAPKDVDDWLRRESEREGVTKTDVLTRFLTCAENIDLNIVEEIAKEFLIHPGVLINVAVEYFRNATKKDQASAIARFYSTRIRET